MTAVLVDRYVGRLDRIRDTAARSMLAIWDSLGRYTYDQGDIFHDRAAPIVTAASATAVSATSAFLTLSTGTVPPASHEAIAANLTAHLYDPFDVVGNRLASGMPWAEAVEVARSTVEDLATEASHGAARTAMADHGPPTRYVRRLSGPTCEWCMKFSGVEFSDPYAADFGHLRCDCTVLPVTDDLLAHNQSIRDEVGFDAQAENVWDKRQQRARLRESIDNAKARQADAARQLRTEADPARRERLSIREQEWETRAEFAAERLRLLETGSHQLA